MSAESSQTLSDFEHTMVFVAHGGPLEAKGALLAASLAEYYRPGKIACRVMEPVARWGALSDTTQALFDQLGVEILTGRNEIDDSYPHGNKIASMRGIKGRCIFLDSDILLMSPFSWHYSLNADSALKPADIDTYTAGGGSWARVWDLFDLRMPGKAYTATVSNERMRPYFNAGFIVVRNGDAFSEVWLDTARKIDHDDRIVNKRPWLDQVALPVALARLGWKTNELSEAFNFPCHLSPIGAVHPYFAHYHWPKVVAESAPMMFRVRALVRKYPSLKDILQAHDEWVPVLKAL